MRTSGSNTLLSGKRPLAIFGMLLASLLLMGVLGWQSWRLQQSNDAAAESVLREYGILVADEFGRRITAELGYRGYYELISSLDGSQSAAEMSAATADAAILADGFFVYDGDDLITDNMAEIPELETVLEQIYADPQHSEGPYRSQRVRPGGQQLIYASRTGPGGGNQLVGFHVSSSGVSNYLQRAFDTDPLLPTALAGGRVSNDLLFVEVTEPGGKILFTTNERLDSTLAVSKTLGNDYQGIVEGFQIRVSVDPSSASSLLIGGLPASRLPLLLAVMAMTVITMLTAIWLFRREHAVMKLRTDFVSQVSHELRTPLTQIRLFAETLLLDRTRTREEHRRCLEIIDRESRRLSHLVENILRVSNISDTTRIDCRFQELAPLLHDVCETMQATWNGATIKLDADETAAASIDADALRQVLLNLLDNAVKYGPHDQEIVISMTSAGAVTRITVEDQGPGIPEAERARVWGAFYRLKREQDTAISGTGIGLSVVRELVEAMHGRCWIDAANGGTRVNLEFGK